jgi:hypothetical protein
MEKGQLPIFAELTLADTEDSTAKAASSKFTGTDNPRHLRVIHSALVRSRKREEIDRIAGCSNAPELIAELRRRGLEFPCVRVPAIDRDGYPIRYGVYHLTNDDRRLLAAWQRLRDARGKA